MRPIRHLIIGLGALIAILGFVLGVPAALISSVGWPLPATIPTFDQIELGLRGGIDPQLIIKTLAVIVWIVWAQLVIVIVAECVAVARGRSTRQLPVLPGLQPAVAHLVAAVTLAVATLGPLRTAPALATPIPVAASSPHQLSASAEHGDVTEEGRPAAEPTMKTGPTYRVARHDTLWRVAELTLGDGRRWTEIRALNTGRTMVDGRPFTATTETITPGWTLLLPGDAIIPDATSDSDGVVTVEPGDNFWTIATDTLTEAWDRPPTNREVAAYWRDLIDTNRQRLAPPHDPDLIYPGQTFELPPIPTDPAAVETASARGDDPNGADDGQVVVERGDSFWRIAESALADAWGHSPTPAEIIAYWEALVDANRHRLTPPHDPDLIHPGQVFILPPIPADPNVPGAADTAPESPPPTAGAQPRETPTTSSPTPQTPTTPATTPRQSTPAAQAPTPNQDQVETPETAPIDTDLPESDDSEATGGLVAISSRLAGLAVLAAGLVALLRRLRGAQLRHRRPGTIPTPPSPESATVEAMIHTAAAPTVTELIDLTLRVMARDINESHTNPPDVVGVHVTTDTLRLLLWTPHLHPPAGWQVEDEGRSWTTPTAVDVDRLRVRAHGVPAPYPALVTVGHGDHTQLLLNLEHLGATQITGDPDDVLATCYTMATELAASPLADDLQVICVGFGTDLAQLERVRTVDNLADLLSDLDAKATAVTRSNANSTLEGRMSPAGGDTWDPIVAIDPTTTSSEEANRLVAIAHAGKTVAALVGYPTGDRWRLHVQDDTIRVEPLGHTYARRNLTPKEQTAVGDLIAAAADLEGLPAHLVDDPLPHAEHEPYVSALESESEATLFDEPDRVVGSEPATTPEIKLLGTIRVEGLDRRFPLRRCTELVAYLTFHRAGVEADMLMEALWPEEPPDYQRLNRHTYRTRATLGTGPDGEPYVPYITDGIYRISPHLHSDIERFTSLIREADRTTGDAAAEHLRAALHLVEGTPFTGAGTGYIWAHTQGIITHAIVAIDNAAHRLAEHALAADDPAEATWAARQGLLATGACEQCYRHLMRAALAEGNHVAFEATFQELLAVTDADDGSDATTYLEPETIELYEQATQRRRRHAG